MAEDDFKNSSAERRSEVRKGANSIYGAELNLPGIPTLTKGEHMVRYKTPFLKRGGVLF